MVAEDLKIINFWEQDCLRPSVFAITYFGHAIRLKKVTTFINNHADPSWHLHDKSQYWKHQSNVWNLFKLTTKTPDVAPIFLLSNIWTLRHLFSQLITFVNYYHFLFALNLFYYIVSYSYLISFFPQFFPVQTKWGFPLTRSYWGIEIVVPVM